MFFLMQKIWGIEGRSMSKEAKLFSTIVLLKLMIEFKFGTKIFC